MDKMVGQTANEHQISAYFNASKTDWLQRVSIRFQLNSFSAALFTDIGQYAISKITSS